MFLRPATLAAAVWLATSPVCAQPITGSYSVEGRNADGSPYAGRLALTETGGAVAAQWQVGAQGYSGTGTRDGRILEIDWGQPHPVVYVLMPNGALHGTWSDGRALEKAVPTR